MSQMKHFCLTVLPLESWHVLSTPTLPASLAWCTGAGAAARESETIITKLGEGRKDSDERSKTTIKSYEKRRRRPEGEAARALMRHVGFSGFPLDFSFFLLTVMVTVSDCNL
jgi:hypothetical protein